MPDPILRSNHGPIPHHASWGGTGATLDETKAAQKPSAKAAAEAVAEEVADHLVVHAGEKGAGAIAEAVGSAALEHAVHSACLYLGATLAVTENAFKVAVVAPTERGEALAAARDADAARYVIAAVVQAADAKLLPDGYLVEAHVHAVGNGNYATQFQNVAFRVAGTILGQVANGDREAVQFRDTMKRCVSEGIAAAHAKDIRTPEALDELREHDPDFAKRWENDAGFQVGVRAALWQAETHPEEFDAANRERAELQMSLRLPRYA